MRCVTERRLFPLGPLKCSAVVETCGLALVPEPLRLRVCVGKGINGGAVYLGLISASCTVASVATGTSFCYCVAHSQLYIRQTTRKIFFFLVHPYSMTCLLPRASCCLEAVADFLSVFSSCSVKRHCNSCTRALILMAGRCAGSSCPP